MLILRRAEHTDDTVDVLQIDEECLGLLQVPTNLSILGCSVGMGYWKSLFR